MLRPMAPAAALQPGAARPAQRVAITGTSGLIGSHLAALLRARGHAPVPVVRRAARPGEIAWDPARGEIDPAPFAETDAVVHLAGESIAAGRWTPARLEAIRRSRVEGTRLLAQALARCAAPPRALISASAVGIYGDRGDEILTEASPPGSGFLAELARAWEEATAPAQGAGIRVVHLRIGMVLSAAGGALPRLLPVFRLGLGGRLGHGRQFMSWIALDDLLEVISHALADERLSGPVNAVSPQPVTNREFTEALGRVLRRPTVLPAPAPLLRLVFGEVADALLLASTRVVPARLTALGFRFQCADLTDALRWVLRRGQS